MNIYLLLLIPVVTVLVLFFFFRHKVTWWEFLVPLGASIIFIFVGKHVAISSLTIDTQYLGGYVKEVRYYEAWNEKVSCRHPKYRTSCSGSGKTRSCRQVFAGYRHAYDVDYHPEYWTQETNLNSYKISSTRYKEILYKKFKLEKETFHELNRHYHTDDGDMYSGTWNGDDETLVPITVEEKYENRPMASHSIYRFEDVDTIDIKQYKPFDYPQVDDRDYQKTLLGADDPVAERKLSILNARLGKPKHVRVFVLVFKNQPVTAGHIQERYWQGSNKNEFVICVGTDSQDHVMWAYDFSWTEVEEAKIETREFLLAQDTLNLSSLVEFTDKEIQTRWIPRNFHEFDILTIEPSITAIVWIFILTVLINVGISWWAIANEYSEDN